MKKQFLSIALIVVATSVSFAKTIRVNNNLDPNPDENLYANIQSAHDEALTGDTILIEGSLTAYSEFEINKKLVIIGPGYFLDQNLNTPENKKVANLRGIDVNNGAQGSIITGCVFLISGYVLNLSASNITIKGNYFDTNAKISIHNEDGETNITFSGNFVKTDLFNFRFSSENVNNISFNNNIILGDFVLGDDSSGLIVNNIFKGNQFNLGSTSGTLQIYNNILLSLSDSASADIVLPAGIGSNLAHNISNGQFGNANNNITGFYESEIFINSGTDDGKYMIKVGGPADGAGQQGFDIGAFGGPNPYKLSGLNNMPVIYELSTDGYADDDGNISVQIKAKSY